MNRIMVNTYWWRFLQLNKSEGNQTMYIYLTF